MNKNVVVAQSGGPSPVINASLYGVISACRSRPEIFGRILGAWHGVEGILKEELIDLDAQDPRELDYLKYTPASGFIGTCRYKLGEDQQGDFERILQVFKAHNVGYFFYIGGNDSMDTAHKVSELAMRKGMDLIVIGIPKTIDNDLGDDEFTIIDHTPGYGSTARYWAYITQNVNQENTAISVSESVAVLQAMGRTSGFIPAAARLADPRREMPLQLYLAETDHNLESMAENVNACLKERGRCIVVVSEGFNAGALGEAHDGFGHIQYGASRTTVAQTVVNYLNDHGLAARGQATGQVPGVLQRCTSLFASEVDINEACEVAVKAVELAAAGESGWMATLLRRPGDDYEIYYDKVKLHVVANSVRHLPSGWITPDGLDVTDDFIRYARPLIGEGNPSITLEGGLQRFARLNRTFIPQTLPPYELQAL